MSNKNMIAAKKAKNDEFYTQMGDICAELTHQEYIDFFRGKHVFLNCDDPQQSNFWKFFSLNFMHLGLKQLTATHYDATKPTYRLDLYADLNNDGIIDDNDLVVTPLQGNGDFRNQECIDILNVCDVVVTNPPFSLFREYIEQLMTYNKKFVCIANMNSINYKEIFKHIQNNEIWPGYGFNKTMEFMVPDSYKFNREENGIKYGKVPAIMWLTNIDLKKKYTPLLLCKEYIGHENEYPIYDNYNAIECGKVCDIPKDYYGIIGVPNTFLGQYNPNQFEIIGFGSGELASSIGVKKNYRGRTDLAITRGGISKCPYARILIRRKI